MFAFYFSNFLSSLHFSVIDNPQKNVHNCSYTTMVNSLNFVAYSEFERSGYIIWIGIQKHGLLMLRYAFNTHHRNLNEVN